MEDTAALGGGDGDLRVTGGGCKAASNNVHEQTDSIAVSSIAATQPALFDSGRALQQAILWHPWPQMREVEETPSSARTSP